jgi:membrane-associated phospholipid phosphatase
MAIFLTVALLSAGPSGAGDESWPVPAQEAAGAAGSPFEIDLALDLPLLGAAVAAAAVPALFVRDLGGPACGASCDPSGLNALDRTVVGNRSPGAARASDALLGLGLALPFALDLVDVLVSRPGDGFHGYGKDTLVLAQSLALSLALNQALKLAVRRPRPYAYDPAVPPAERGAAEAGLSFYSGHAALAFTAATAYATLFTLRHPDSGWVVPVWLGTHLLAASTAYLRVHAGKHFWTDVLAGALVGSAVGWVVPFLHRQAGPARAAGSGLGAREGARFGLAPLPLPGGGGLVLEVRLEP